MSAIMATISDLCTTCNTFDLYSFQRDVEGYRGYSFDKITSGHKEGCRFFAMLPDCCQGMQSDETYVHLKLEHFDQPDSATSLGVCVLSSVTKRLSSVTLTVRKNGST